MFRSLFSPNRNATSPNRNATSRLQNNRSRRNRSLPRSRNLGPTIPNIVRQNNRSIPNSRPSSPILNGRGPIPRAEFFSLRPYQKNQNNNEFDEYHNHDLPSDPTQALKVLNMRYPPNPETFYTKFTQPSNKHPLYNPTNDQLNPQIGHNLEFAQESARDNGPNTYHMYNPTRRQLNPSIGHTIELQELNEEIFRQMLIYDLTQLEEPANSSNIPSRMYSNPNFLKEKKKDRAFINSVIEDHMLIYRTKGPDAAIRSWYNWIETHRKQFINSWRNKTTRYRKV
jgi:hypothetical protein